MWSGDHREENDMPAWNSRGLRGSAFEERINLTNEKLRDRGLALVQKIPTPITPIEMDKEHGHITLAYFDKKSTVDYVGVVQGVPVCFDAKESATDTFALSNVHEHQIRFMEDFENQDGVAFLLISFTGSGRLYYMRTKELKAFWDRAQNGGRKSVRTDELDEDYFFGGGDGLVIPYLEMLQKDLSERD